MRDEIRKFGDDLGGLVNNLEMKYVEPSEFGTANVLRKVAEATRPYGDLESRTFAYALKVVSFFDGLPDTRVSMRLGDQALRSGTSVGAHYREARRARSNAEFISKLEVLLQELDEAMYWIKLLRDSKQTTAEVVAPLLNESNQLIAIFVTCVKKVKETPKKGAQ